MRSECDQRRVGLSRERTRHQHRLAERPAQPLEPADQIDGGADRREIQAVGSADIAPQHLAEMQRGAERQRRQALPLPLLIEMRHAAPRAAVFAFLTHPEKIISWMGAEATTEAHPGGLYLVKGVGNTMVARGAFREVVPVHRLAYSFGWDGVEEVPPGSSLIEIDLIDRDGGTLLRMTHSGLPNPAQCASHDRGWAHYLGRLAIAASGRNPGGDRGPMPHDT